MSTTLGPVEPSRMGNSQLCPVALSVSVAVLASCALLVSVIFIFPYLLPACCTIPLGCPSARAMGAVQNKTERGPRSIDHDHFSWEPALRAHKRACSRRTRLYSRPRVA